MQVYCVLLVGEPFLLDRDGEKTECGFHRNEYVLASSPDQAVEKAKSRALAKLRNRPLQMIEGRPFVLKADEVRAGMPLTRLLRNEGFVFFNVDS